jgi:hypothetical protein
MLVICASMQKKQCIIYSQNANTSEKYNAIYMMWPKVIGPYPSITETIDANLYWTRFTINIGGE